MNKLKARGSNVILEGTVKTKTTSGIIIAGEEKRDDINRTQYIESVKAISVGEDVKGIKKGDKVVILKETSMNLSYNVKNWMFDDEKEGNETKYKDKFYIVVPEETIKAVYDKKN
jgi:hypothetical protein